MTNSVDIEIEHTAIESASAGEPTSQTVKAAADEPLEDAPSEADASDPDGDSADPATAGRKRLKVLMPTHRKALLLSLVIFAVVAAPTGWLGWRTYQLHELATQRAHFVEAARRGALDLTTIDWQHADADVGRILNGSAGTLYDDFSKRSQAFIDVLKKTQAKSEGTITAAGLESASAAEAQVLVAVSVKITNGDAPEQHPRAWRMRISVQNIGHEVKVTKVEFVP